jgi:hypothetical protein
MSNDENFGGQDFERSRRHLADERLSTEQLKTSILSDANHRKEMENINAKFENGMVTAKLRAAERKIRELEGQVEDYEILLCKPMHEIAAVNGKFKETYQEQMEIMANWMVSQKAFKELAIQFGYNQGLEIEKVKEMAVTRKLDVLESRNPEKHGTNANEDEFLEEHVDTIKEQVIKRISSK